MYYNVYEQFVSVAAFIQYAYMLTCLSLNSYFLSIILILALMKGVDKYLFKFIKKWLILADTLAKYIKYHY